MHRHVPFDADEKTALQACLDRQRAVVRWKVRGLDDAALRRQWVPSGTSLLGLVKHLGAVEYDWFCGTFGRECEALPFREDDSEADLTISADETTQDILDFYDRATATSNRIIEELSLEDTGTSWYGATVTLRWVMLHMIQELARHAGHLDILRELTDGSTGDFE